MRTLIATPRTLARPSRQRLRRAVRASSLIDVPYTAKAWTEVAYGGRRLCLRPGMDAPVDYHAFVPSHGAQPVGLSPDIFAPPQAALDVDWTGDGTCSNDNGLAWAYAWLASPE